MRSEALGLADVRAHRDPRARDPVKPAQNVRSAGPPCDAPFKAVHQYVVLLGVEVSVMIEDTTYNGHGPDSESGDCVDMEVYTAVDGRIVVLRRQPGLRLLPDPLVAAGFPPRPSPWCAERVMQACYSELFGSDCTYWADVTYVKHDPPAADVGPGADDERRRQVGRPDDPRSAFWSAAT